MIRFNEAIDHALAGSVAFFSDNVEEARKGHDMRAPLQAIQMTAIYLAAQNAGTQVSEAARHHSEIVFAVRLPRSRHVS